MIEVLSSYHYVKTLDLRALLAGIEFDLFADSGAYSAMTLGAQISVGEYAEWLRHNAGLITCAATLDVIGDWRATAHNTDRLLALVGGAVQVVPAFHVRSPWSELRRLCREFDYVALGGLVPLSGRGYEAAMLRWAANAHVIARDHDVRLHGFGLTRPPYPQRLPFYSIDSAYWASGARTGSLSLWNDRTHRFDSFRVGTENARPHARLIGEYGGDARAACAYGFGIQSRVGPRGQAERAWLESASMTSLLRFGRWLRRVKPEVPAPRGGRVVRSGPKLYLAACHPWQFQAYRRVATAEGLIGVPA